MEARTMINSETMATLRNMKLRGMAETLRSQEDDPAVQELSFEERFGLLVDSEYLKRRNALLQRLVRTATLKLTSACMEGIEYDADRRLDKDLPVRLSSCTYVAEHRDIIIMGATGVGKTYVGCALGTAVLDYADLREGT
jgi:DNA replication protein DnaC